MVKFVVVMKTDLFLIMTSEDARIDDIFQYLKPKNQRSALHFGKILV